jgi:hypothetical protein
VAAGHAVTFVAQRGESGSGSGSGLIRRMPVARWVARDPSKAVRERPVCPGANVASWPTRVSRLQTQCAKRMAEAAAEDHL